jgi:cytochrome c-type biogenesis protein CcmH/NrfF
MGSSTGTGTAGGALAAALLAAALVTARAQGPEEPAQTPGATAAKADAATTAAAAPAAAVDPALLAAARSEVVDPFLARVKGKLGSAEALAGWRQEIRVLAGDLEAWTARRLPEPAKRPAFLAEAREALVQGLAAERGGEGGRREAESVVISAGEDRRKRRTEKLERDIMCWCKKEDWTKTLAGCPEGCANEQKGLIQEWMGKGLTDDEIIDRMVAHPDGGPRVRAVPVATGTNRLGFILPFVILGVAAVLVAVFLRAAVRPARSLVPPESPVASRQPPAASDDSVAIGDRIEKELEEMGR